MSATDALKRPESSGDVSDQEPASSPLPQGNESTLTAEQAAAIERAEPANWRTDYYAFRKNVSVVDGKISWGQMKQFAHVFQLVHASGEAQMEAMRQDDKAKKQQLANKYFKLNAEATDAIKKLGKLNWTARVLANPRRRKTPVQLDLPDLPQPARITFLIPEDEEPQWDSVREGDTIHFRCGLTWGGYPESPDLAVRMHLLN